MKKITFLAVEGCLSSSITSLIDGFTIANITHRALTSSDSNLFVTKVVTEDGEPVTCSNCVQIQPHFSINEKSTSDYLIVPAFLPVPEVNTIRESRLLDYIREQYSIGTTIASVCTGAFFLAETGLLDGRSATTNWQFEQKFRYRYPKVDLHIGKMLTETENLICSGAVSSMMHIALKIIQREGSTRLASAWAKAMLIDPNNENQVPYAIFPLDGNHRDTEILKAEQYMRTNLVGSITIDHIAEYVGISPRHFKRRFKTANGDSPSNYLQKLRIQKAKDQLENTLASMDEITRCVGYEDSRTFRRLFKRHTSLSPKEYRNRFLLLEEA